MTTANLPVKLHCPISNTVQTVYFHPAQLNGQWYVDINSFNGCDLLWHNCQECEACKAVAYAKIFSQDT